MMLAAMSKPLAHEHGSTLKLHRGAGFGEVSKQPAEYNSGGKLPIPETGTPLAISYLTLGVAAQSAKRSGRGGARNRADRESRELKPARIADLKAAERHAAAIGLIFTRMITIHWASAGVTLDAMPKATGKFLDLLSRGLRRHDSEAAYLWVAENAGGEKNWHVHILAHVPARLVRWLTGIQKRWLRRIAGRPYKSGAIYSRPIGPTLGLEHSNPDLHAENLAVAFGYHVKGAPPVALAAAGIDRAHQPGGRIIGKRTGTSENIGAKARKAGVRS